MQTPEALREARVHETGQRLLRLMFKQGETVCISHNKYGWHSIPLENAINGPITLVPPSDDRPWEYPKPEEITMVALNPIKGFRTDLNCTAFRSFLVEMDCGPLPEQLAYIKKLGMPYSAVVFSGNKSLHFLITLDKDLPSENVYRVFSEWILTIMTLADPLTKNPSRSIRVPGAYRSPDKRQALVEFKGAVKLAELVAWLNKYPDAKPKEKEVRTVSENPDFSKVKGWACKLLVDGINPPNRNAKWFSVAMEFALSGYEEDYILEVLRPYFSPDRDFKEREWKTTIRSGFKKANERKR